MTRTNWEKFQELKARGEKAFIPFIMAGDPDLETTIRLVPELERAGSHIVELGIPFSDPVADGPTIQRAGARALRHQYGFPTICRRSRQSGKKTDVPLLLFSYFNPDLPVWARVAGARCAGCGNGRGSGDRYDSRRERRVLRLHGRNDLDCVFLVAPTSSEERIAKIAECSRGFVYVVSRTGVTGAQQELSALDPSDGGTRPQPHAASGGRRIRHFQPGAGAGGLGDLGWSRCRERHCRGNGKNQRSARHPLQAAEFCRWLLGH